MANALAFDTLAYARRLKEAGVDDAQAEAHAEAVRDAVTEGVATKADTGRIEGKVENLGSRVESLEGKVENLGSRVGNIEGKIENLADKIENFATKADEKFSTRADLYRVLWIQTGIIIGAVVALIKLLP